MSAYRGQECNRIPGRSPRSTGNSGRRIRHWRTGRVLLPRHHAHHGGRTRSAAPSDYSCTRVDATPELLLDSADHTLEQHYCQPFGGGTEESSGMSTVELPVSFPSNFSASAERYTR